MRINTITGPDINNGLGNRITLWVSGCSHNCPGCHNPETHYYLVGEDISIEENFNKIFNIICEHIDKPFIKGITLSGGDPLDQDNESLTQLSNLLSKIKIAYPDKDIWIYSGDVYEELITHPLKHLVLSLCDVLVDGPFILEKRDTKLSFRGSSNQRIIDLQKSDSKHIEEIYIP